MRGSSRRPVPCPTGRREPRETSLAIWSHMTIAWRCALLLVTTVSCARRLRQLEGEAQDALDAGARVMMDTSVAPRSEALVHAAADAEYSPSLFSRTMTQFRSSGPQRQRRVDAGQDARRAHVGVLVEALADLQPQAPQRDVVGMCGSPASRRDGVLVADGVQAIVRHHHAVRGTSRRPSRSSRTRSGRPLLPGDGFQHLPGRPEPLPCRCRRQGSWRSSRSSWFVSF